MGEHGYPWPTASAAGTPAAAYAKSSAKVDPLRADDPWKTKKGDKEKTKAAVDHSDKKCYYCKKVGHRKVECRKWIADTKKAEGNLFGSDAARGKRLPVISPSQVARRKTRRPEARREEELRLVGAEAPRPERMDRKEMRSEDF